MQPYTAGSKQIIFIIDYIQQKVLSTRKTCAICVHKKRISYLAWRIIDGKIQQSLQCHEIYNFLLGLSWLGILVCSGEQMVGL